MEQHFISKAKWKTARITAPGAIPNIMACTAMWHLMSADRQIHVKKRLNPNCISQEKIMSITIQIMM